MIYYNRGNIFGNLFHTFELKERTIVTEAHIPLQNVLQDSLIALLPFFFLTLNGMSYKSKKNAHL